MSYLNRLIQKEEGTLPTVKPRVPGLFETYPLTGTDQNSINSTINPDTEQVVKRKTELKSENLRTLTNKEDNSDKSIEHKLSQHDRLESNLVSLTFPKIPLKNNLRKEERTSKLPTTNKVTNEKQIREEYPEGILLNDYNLNKKVNNFDSGNSGTQYLHNAEFSEKKNLVEPLNTNYSLINEEPSIKVSIGKVEVRAIIEKNPVPLKKKPERKPKISLQEYFDKKNKS